MTTDQAQARPVPGWSRYVVGRDGLVRSLRFDPPKVICHRKRGGYLYVQFSKMSSRYEFAVHRLVAEIWLPDPLPGQIQVRHLNGDPFDNRLENLAWGTARDNAEDRMRHGRGVLKDQKTHCINGHEYTEENTYRWSSENGYRRCKTCEWAKRRGLDKRSVTYEDIIG